MASNVEKVRADFERLVKTGDELLQDILSEVRQEKIQDGSKKTAGGIFHLGYQSWYSEASALIRQMLPERIAEFCSLYESDQKRKVINNTNFSISDWLLGIRATTNFRGEKNFSDGGSAVMRFATQTRILESIRARLNSSLFDIEHVVQAELFDSELDAADELLKKGFLRASGVIVGVVLEKHLEHVCSSHKIAVTKSYPGIGDFNDCLKNAGTIDLPSWRFNQHLGDLRNLCAHNKDREPTKDDVVELIAGVRKVSKTLL